MDRQHVWRLSGPPLALQIIVLLLGGLVVAQLVTLLLTLLLPPEPQQQYNLNDIARALSGQKVSVSGSRPLQRMLQAGPPALTGPGWLTSERSRHDLAMLLNRDDSDVLLSFFTPLPFAGTAQVPRRTVEAFPHREARLHVADVMMGDMIVGDDAILPREGLIPAKFVQLAQAGPMPNGFPGGFPGGYPAGPAAQGFPGRFPGGPPMRPPMAGTPNGAPASPPVSAPSGVTAPTGPQGVVRPSPVIGGPETTPGNVTGPAFIAPSPIVGRPIAPPVSGSMSIFSGPPTLPPLPAVMDPPQPETPAKAPPETPLPKPRLHSAETAPAPQIMPRQEKPEPAPEPTVAPEPRKAAAPQPRPASGSPALPVTPPARGLFGLAPAPFVEGDFVAALKLPGGQWAVVQPVPQSFPNSWQRRVLLWFLISFALVTPLGWIFARRVVRPLTGFALAAERLGRDPRAPILALEGPAELGRAAHAFNRMQSRLKSFVDDRTAFVGAISHDLRTPLTRLRFRIEDVPDDLREGMLAEVDEMEQMISSVLNFIRDASEPGTREQIDLSSLVEDVIEDAIFVGKDVTLAQTERTPVEVDALGMRRLLGNLVENAVKYGEKAEVRLFTDEQEAVAEIRDNGPGLPDDELERVFQPFYRAPSARASSKHGTGLGLAVCRSIARAHGGDVKLARGPHGLVAQLRLPLAYGTPA